VFKKDLIMSKNQATAQWQGTLKEGAGTVTLPKANVTAPFTFSSRFETGSETNPEELVGAALAGCYSMFLSALLSGNGFTPKTIDANATVTLEEDATGPCITAIALEVSAQVPDLLNEQFQGFVNEALEKCPISRLYAGTQKTVNASLLALA
jgi:lipoyl-dependent peroxiredoxin